MRKISQKIMPSNQNREKDQDVPEGSDSPIDTLFVLMSKVFVDVGVSNININLP